MTYSKLLQKEIEDFKEFTTNRFSDCEKRYIKRESTFELETRKGIILFIEYLAKDKGIDVKKIRTLHTYLIYFNDYVSNQMKKYNGTSTFKNHSNFIYSLIHYFKATLKLTQHQIYDLNMILEKYRKQRGIDITPSKRAKNKEERQQTDIKIIADGIKKLETSYYEKTKTLRELKALVVLKILFFLCWRASNIFKLKIGDNIYKKEGKWYYRFPPEQQKVPLKLNGISKSIEGVFPDVIQKDLDLFISLVKPTGLLFKDKSNAGYIGNFTDYVYNITKRFLGVKLNPHVFRDIVFSWLVENNCERDGQMLLWHKLTILSSSDKHYFKYDTNGSVLRANDKLVSLYGGRGSTPDAPNSSPKPILITDIDEIEMIMVFRKAKKKIAV